MDSCLGRRSGAKFRLQCLQGARPGGGAPRAAGALRVGLAAEDEVEDADRGAVVRDAGTGGTG